MKFGGAMFFTEYSMTSPELAVALEERGYDSVWAPEHSHNRSRARRRSQAAANCPSNMPMRWTRSWS
jgi:alkanesulfonate monooxygenase SsuD/methylene tetrahydromethanopterin reductase-like flavin-dependent oxidoreductase (luciferase family)